MSPLEGFLLHQCRKDIANEPLNEGNRQEGGGRERERERVRKKICTAKKRGYTLKVIVIVDIH